MFDGKKLAISLALVVISIIVSRAQINIESQRKSLETNGWRFEAKSYLTVNQGNSDVIKFDNSGGLFYLYERHLWFTVLNFSMGEKAKVRFINKGMGHFRYNYKISDLISGEGFTQSEYNEFTRLKFRWLGGGGIRLRFVDSQKYNAALGLAGMYEYEKLDIEVSPAQKEETKTLRASTYLSLGIFLSEIMTFNFTCYVQPSVESIADVRVLSDADLEFKISKSVGFEVSFNLRFDNQPPPGIKAADLELKNGIVIHI